MHEHPPRFDHDHKRMVFEVCSPPEAVHSGTLEASRWAVMDLPERVDLASAVALIGERPGFFDYSALDVPADAVEWHVNFADPHLFIAYASSLMAQDELQVLEHPALGAFLEAINADGSMTPRTADRTGPTPILIAGVERRLVLDTENDKLHGRYGSLYGNAFARASADEVRAAVTILDPPTITNLIAMSATQPDLGQEAYDEDDIRFLIATAFTGFRAAVLESERMSAGAPVVVHTGFWGCGAFGGNRVLMTLLQTVAAQMAGLTKIVFHTGDPSGDRDLAEMRLTLGDMTVDEAEPTDRLIDELEAMAFPWGESDGN